MTKMIKDSDILERLYNSKMEDKIIVTELKNKLFEVKSSRNEYLMIDTFEAVKKEIERVIEHNLNNALLNAKDCLKYGYSKQHWNNCGVSEKLACDIWKQAIKELEKC